MSSGGVRGESLGDKLFRALENPAQRLLAVGGFFIAFAGLLFTIWAKSEAQSERTGNDILVALAGMERYDPFAGDSFEAWANVGIGAIIIGVLMILTVVAIKAARPRP